MIARFAALLHLTALLAAAQAPQDDTVHFTVTADYLSRLANQKSIQVTLELTPFARTKRVHALAADCEIHLTARSKVKLGQPGEVVVEPPNVCKFDPPGGTWPTTLDGVLGKKCSITGFPRLFTEHAKGRADPANPNHFLELHPASEIDCGSTDLRFSGQLKYFKGMRAIQPATAASCLQNRKLWMRKKNDAVEFHQEPGAGCGNFVIVQVMSLDQASVRGATDGFVATARVSANGVLPGVTARLFGLEDSPGAAWLEHAGRNGLNQNRVFVHGMLTYDTLAIAKQFQGIGARAGGEWRMIPAPLALVIFGFPKAP